MLSHLLALYAEHYAQAAIKDHIFGVIHPALAALPWADFRPRLTDVDAMMKIISQFLPQCHAFLGTIFVQMDWQTFVAQQEEGGASPGAARLLPALFCLLVKLSSEPSVRQSGRLLGILTQAERWPWRGGGGRPLREFGPVVCHERGRPLHYQAQGAQPSGRRRDSSLSGRRGI